MGKLGPAGLLQHFRIIGIATILLALPAAAFAQEQTIAPIAPSELEVEELVPPPPLKNPERGRVPSLPDFILPPEKAPEREPPPPDFILPPEKTPEREPPPPDFLKPNLEPSEELATPIQSILKPFELDPPLGFTGPSSVVPRSGSNADFETVEDRWRIGFPYWDRYGLGFPLGEDYPYKLGKALDPYNQNVLKGDFPIIGQHTFLNLSVTYSSLLEPRQLPTATTPFESTARAFETGFFGRPNQLLTQNFLMLGIDLFHGDTAFKPLDWRLKVTPAFNVNTLSVQELGVVSPDVTKGTERDRGWVTLEEYFAEVKIADLSPEYDFLSMRVGSQPFTSDFRGFIFSDVNRAARLFGSLNGNRDQFNLAFFRQAEKDTNSGLNSFHDRNQSVAIANWYHQDFLFPGYTVQGSVHYNDDGPSTLFDRNKFLVRPDPVGVFQPHRVQAVYLGWAGDGHIDRYNVSHAFYWALGHDSMNPLAGQPVDINGKMAALEVSYDRDWARFRTSGFYQSGSGNINSSRATGFDSILDNPNFAGSEFSFWGRQNIPLFGVNLTQRNSLVSDLRSSKLQGQSNFVNPGLWIINTGIDFDVTPKLRIINNANYMWFDKTNTLEQFTFQSQIKREIGVDLSSGFEYRPLLNNNVIFIGGVSTLLPAAGFKEIYNNFSTPGAKIGPLMAAFVQMVLAF